MRFSILTIVAAAASIVTATYDYTKVLKDIATIQADTETLTTQVNSFQGGDIRSALQINSQSNRVLSDTRHAATHAKLSKPFGDTGSSDVASAILKLQPKIYSLLDALQKKKPEFDKKIAGISPSKIVLKSLQDSKKASDEFGANAQEKLNDFFKKFAPIVQADIDKHFDAAIKTYSS